MYSKMNRTFGHDVLMGVSFHISFVQIDSIKVLMRDLLLHELTVLLFVLS